MIDGLSFQGQYTLATQLCSDANADNLTMLKTLIRQGQRRLEAVLGCYFTQETRTFATVASTQPYKLPENFKKLIEIYVTSGSVQYQGELIQDDDLWRQINCNTTTSYSNFLQLCFIRRSTIELYPIPSSALTATIIYDAFTKPLSHDDYTTGTITTLTNGAMAVTASGSTFTSAMAGRYFKIDDDGQWYKIASYGTATTLTLDSAYQGVSIATGTSAYTIGEFPITPPETHELPVYYAVWKWALFRKDITLAREFERMWKEGINDAERNWANRSYSSIVRSHPHLVRRGLVNPNEYPLNMS